MAKMTVEELAAQLRAALGADLRTIALYGSSAAGEQHVGTSDTNVLVLVDSLPGGKLRAASAAIGAWVGSGHTAPLLLTTDEWRSSADIFAMEFADILDRHQLLHGAFPATIEVDPANLRLQLERESMIAVLQLRRSSMAASDWRTQLAILERGTGSLLAVCRAVLRLRGDKLPRDDAELVARVADAVGCDAAPFARIVQHRRGAAPIKGPEAAQTASGCLEGLERIVKYLDHFKVGGR